MSSKIKIKIQKMRIEYLGCFYLIISLNQQLLKQLWLMGMHPVWEGPHQICWSGTETVGDFDYWTVITGATVISQMLAECPNVPPASLPISDYNVPTVGIQGGLIKLMKKEKKKGLLKYISLRN